MKKMNRRQFVRSGIALGAGLWAAPALIARGANERVRIGGIGCGGRSGEIVGTASQLPNVDVVALADPDEARLGEKKSHFANAETYRDLRQLLDNPNVDAVFIATCNHWHCLAAVWAMQAGKHVYVEKPLSHTPWEGQQVVNAARKYKRVCQLGTQQRSDPMQAEIKKFLHEDKALGEILSARVNHYSIRKPIGLRTTPLPIPESVDYNLWLGPAEDKPLFRNKLHYDWHWDWNTGCGEMGNWGVHVLDDMKNNVLLDKVKLPKRVFGGGARVLYNDAGQTPNVHFVYFDTGIIPVVLGMSNIPNGEQGGAGRHVGPNSGYIAYCEGGMLFGHRGGGKALDKEGKTIREFHGDGGEQHQKNFIDAVVAEDPTMLHTEVSLGNDSTDWCNLANIAFRCGKPCTEEGVAALNGQTEGRWEELMGDVHDLLGNNKIDFKSGNFMLGPMLEVAPDACRFVGKNADLGNAFVKRSYRKGFEVPEIK